MQAAFTFLPRQRWEWPRPPSRVNHQTKFGRDCVFAALYNERGGAPYDVAAGGGVGSINGNASYVSGPFAPCVFAVDAGGFVKFGNPDKLKFTNTSDFTFVSLIFHTATSQWFPQVLANDTGVGTRNLLHWRLDNADHFQAVIGSSGATFGIVTGAVGLTVNTLYMGAFVRVHGVSLSVYVNGKLDVTGPDAATGVWTLGSATWASAVGGGTAYIGKKYFDFVFSRALTAGEIAELWSDPFSMFAPDALPLSQTALFVRPIVVPPPPTGAVGRLATCGHPLSTACQDWLLT